MGRAHQRVKDDGASAYSIVRMPGFKMDLHKKQQNIIFGELTASRQKLAEENQLLRDELAEAKMIIRLLKMRLDESREAKALKASATAINSKDTTVKQGVPASYVQALEHTKAERSKKKRYLFKQKAHSRRDTFLNPRPPGAKTFHSRRSLSPQQATSTISPRSSFSPIRDQSMANEEGTSAVRDTLLEEVSSRLQKTRIHW